MFQKRQKWLLKRHCFYLNNALYSDLQKTIPGMTVLPIAPRKAPLTVLYFLSYTHVSFSHSFGKNEYFIPRLLIYNTFSEATDCPRGLRVKYVLKM